MKNKKSKELTGVQLLLFEDYENNCTRRKKDAVFSVWNSDGSEYTVPHKFEVKELPEIKTLDEALRKIKASATYSNLFSVIASCKLSLQTELFRWCWPEFGDFYTLNGLLERPFKNKTEALVSFMRCFEDVTWEYLNGRHTPLYTSPKLFDLLSNFLEGEVKKVYIPLFNSSESAIKFILINSLCKNVDFAGVSSEIACDIAASLRDFRLKFPALPLIDYVGGYRGLKVLSTARGERYKLLRTAAMFTRYSKAREEFLIAINSDFYEKQLHERDMSFFPVGCGTAKSDFVHELGHVLDFCLNVRGDKSIKGLFIKLRKKKEVTDKLSGYANKSTQEFIAEAWSEFCCSPHPREIACKVAARILELYKNFA